MGSVCGGDALYATRLQESAVDCAGGDALC